jgi:hypothetical protein
MADNGVFGTGLVLDWELISSAQNSYDFLTQEVVLKKSRNSRISRAHATWRHLGARPGLYQMKYTATLHET